MDTITRRALATAIGTALAACSSAPTMPAETAADIAVDAVDGTWCGTPGAVGPVYINVAYKDTGAARASPDICTVDSGTEVTWRGPRGEPVVFEIAFKATAPLADGGRAPLVAADASGRYKVRRVITGAPEAYAYGIAANGVVTDPAIIIRAAR